MSRSFPARVVSIGKNAAWIALDGEHQPRVADLKRASGKRAMLVPGDRVDARLLEDGRAIVDAVYERGTLLARRSLRGRAKIMAANVDTLVTVTPLASPSPRLLILDQLLAYAELESIDALVVLTKPDLAPESRLAHLMELYGRLGYTVHAVNPKNGLGIDRFRTLLARRQALLCGVSGAGKSSLFRALGGDTVVGETSKHGLGRQTTTAARLWRLPDGFLIDSPGVAEFGLGAVLPRDVAAGFREFAAPAAGCRFSDCTHRGEPDCAVRAAAQSGAIAASRYASFLQILGVRNVPPSRLTR